MVAQKTKRKNPETMDVRDEENLALYKNASSSPSSSSSSMRRIYTVLASTMAVALFVFAWHNETAGRLESSTTTFLMRRRLTEKTIDGGTCNYLLFLYLFAT